MIQDILEALVGLLDEERAPGKLLEGVTKVRKTDAQPIPDNHLPVVTVSFEGAARLRADRSQVEAAWRFEVCLFTLNREGPEASEAELHRLLWRDEGDQELGLIPALLSMAGLVISGRSYMLQVQDDVVAGIVKQDGRYTYGASVLVTVSTMRRRPT